MTSENPALKNVKKLTLRIKNQKVKSPPMTEILFCHFHKMVNTDASMCKWHFTVAVVKVELALRTLYTVS